MRDFTEMKNIPGYEERYAATKDGRIWSYKRKKFLAPCADKDGYLKIEMTAEALKYFTARADDMTKEYKKVAARKEKALLENEKKKQIINKQITP